MTNLYWLDKMPWKYVFDPTQRLFWGYLLSSLVITLIVLFFQIKKDHKIFNLKEFAIACKKYWTHPSALLDYRYFIISWILKVFFIAPILLSAKSVAIFVLISMRKIGVTPMEYRLPFEVITVLYTLALFLFSDFTRYWLHRLLHTNKWLWQFHKVHHSPSVLNPISFYRVHPLENILFGMRSALSIGIVTGIFISIFGARLTVYSVMGSNIFVFLFLAIGSNLRHSHIYLRYPAWLEKIFISPAQHQLHHSRKYHSTNYGGYLAIWDYIHKSLKQTYDVDQPKEYGFALKYMEKYKTIPRLLAQPFIDCYDLFTKSHGGKKNASRYNKTNKKPLAKSSHS